MRFWARFVFSFCITLLLAGCEIKDPASSLGGGAPPGEAPVEKPPATLEYPNGWTEVVIISRYAKTTIDIAGHFLISRNACFKEEGGSLSLEDWNLFAALVNEVIKQNLATVSEETCFQTPDAPFGLDGTVDVVLNNKVKKPLFDVRGLRTCTALREPSIYEPLLQVINRTLRMAMLESCPSGRP